MTYYHIIIATERRSEPTGNVVDGMPEYVAGPAQLHSFSAAGLPENFDTDPQFVMIAEWDGSSPYVIQHKGDYAARTMGYAGWPDITKEQYEEINPSTVSGTL